MVVTLSDDYVRDVTHTLSLSLFKCRFNKVRCPNTPTSIIDRVEDTVILSVEVRLIPQTLTVIGFPYFEVNVS